jgi:acyl-CoA hydrolase
MIIDVETALTYVGRSSAEIAVKVLTENPVHRYFARRAYDLLDGVNRYACVY